MAIKGRKVAILIEKMYEDLEMWYPFLRLKEAGHEPVRVGSGTAEVFPSKHGYESPADANVQDVKAGEFHALVIPGGFAPDFMRRSDAMIDFVAEFAKLNRPIAAICHGVWMLCSAEALQGKQCTSFSGIRHDVMHAGANWVDAEVVVDGNLITSRKPTDLPAFMAELLKQLE